VVFFTTSKGQDYIKRYREIREACLVSSLRADVAENVELGELARFLRALSGLYDQAARSATSL
jgi:predicted MarR family transcription regulator